MASDASSSRTDDKQGEVLPIKGGSATAIASLYRPFGIHWLDSALQETLLPGAPWHKLSEEIEANWSSKLRQVMEHPEKRQMVFEIAGPQFVSQHFADLPNEPMILEEPQMVGRIRKALRADALSFMNSQLQSTVKELGLMSDDNSYQAGDDEASNSKTTALDDFIEETQARFLTALDRHLLLGDQAENFIEESETKEPEERNKHDAQYNNLDVSPLSSAGGRLANKMERKDVEIQKGNNGTGTGPRNNYRQRVFLEPEGKKPFAQSFPGKCWSPESEVLGLSVRSILERDPSRLIQICGKLHGRFLPSTLRSYLWAEVLFQKELSGPSLKSRRNLREQFSRAISRGLVEMQIKKPSRTPINGLIENAVVEMYDKTACMQAYNSAPHMKETVSILNILFCYNRSYESYWVYWLYPLQLSMADHQSQEEHPFNLSMYLDILVRSCYFKWPQIFRMSQNVIKRVQNADNIFYSHLMEACLRDTENLEIKDVIAGLMKMEESKAKEVQKDNTVKTTNVDLVTTARETGDEEYPGTPESTSSSYLSTLTKEDLCNPVIFVRKWIGEGFVSVLDSQAVLLVWDQLMMTQWDSVAMEHFAVAILFLLRNPLMEAQNYFDIKQVLLNLPCELHTRNILHAYKHLHSNGNPIQIPSLINSLDS